MTAAETDKPDPRISGRKLVFVMISMGLLATGLLWFYWNLHLQPFMPLQEALAAEFEESSPRVDGGQRKSHKGTPRVLRVVMRVPFDPNSKDANVLAAIGDRIDRTIELAKVYSTFNEYALLDVHLFYEVKEQRLSQKTFSRDIAALLDEDVD